MMVCNVNILMHTAQDVAPHRLKRLLGKVPRTVSFRIGELVEGDAMGEVLEASNWSGWRLSDIS